MEILLIQGLILIGSLIWNYYQSKSHKPEDPEPAGLDTSRLPMLADRPINVAFGRVWIMAPQVLCYEEPAFEVYDGVFYDSRTVGVGSNNPVFPLGRNYRTRLHLGLCLGRADSVNDVMFDGQTLAGMSFLDWTADSNLVPNFDVDGTALRVTGKVDRIVREIDGEDRLGGGMPGFPGFMGEFWISYGGAVDVFPANAKQWIKGTAGGARESPDFKGITSLVSCNLSVDPVHGEGTDLAPDTILMGLSELAGAAFIGDTRQPPPFGVKLTRIMFGWDGNAQWYGAAAAVYDGAAFVGMNPVHIIRELLVSEIYGMGEPTSRIDAASFIAAADVMVAEKIGVNLVWETQVAIRELVDEILKVCEGLLWFDHANAKWKLTMIRPDYVTADTPILDKNAVKHVAEFSRPSWDDLPNQVTVSYRDPDNWEDINYTITNSSLQALAHRIVAMTVRYASVTNRKLAATLASRDLRQSGTPLARVNLKLKPEWAHLRPGDVVRWTSPDYGIVEMPLRVMAVNTGDGRNNEVTIRCVEDVFGLGTALYPPPDESPWVPPEQTPIPPEYRYLYEAPYWLAKRAGLGDPHVSVKGEPTGDGYVAQLAARSQTDATGYLLEVSPDGGAFVEARPFAPWQARTTLWAPISKGDTVIQIEAVVTPGAWSVGMLLMLADGFNEEFVVITGVDPVEQTLTVTRGCLDTVPSAWDAGGAAPVWVPSRDSIAPIKIPKGGTGASTRVRSITSRGVLPAADALVDGPLVVAERWVRPYPPTKATIDDVWRGAQSYPQVVVRGDLTLRWAYRRRDGSEVYDAGTLPTHATLDTGETCEVEVFDYSDDSLLGSFPTSGASVTIPASVFAGVSDAYLLLWTTRDDGGTPIECWQRVRLNFALLDNLLSPNVATGTDALGDTTGFIVGTGSTRESSTDYAHTGVRSLKVTFAAGATGTPGTIVCANTFAAPSTGLYTGSVWMRTATGERTVTVRLQNNSAGVFGPAVPVTLTTEWQLVTVHSPAVTASNNIRIMVENTDPAAGVVYLDTLAMTLDL